MFVWTVNHRIINLSAYRCVVVIDNKIVAKGQAGTTDETIAECDTSEQAKKGLKRLAGVIGQEWKIWDIEIEMKDRLNW